MPKMTVTTNAGRFVADFEIDDALREAFELEGAPVPDWLQRDNGRDDVGPGSPRPPR